LGVLCVSQQQLGLGHRNIESQPQQLTEKLLHGRMVVDVCCGYGYSVAITGTTAQFLFFPVGSSFTS
jgi:hypothetical protein